MDFDFMVGESEAAVGLWRSAKPKDEADKIPSLWQVFFAESVDFSDTGSDSVLNLPSRLPWSGSPIGKVASSHRPSILSGFDFHRFHSDSTHYPGHLATAAVTATICKWKLLDRAIRMSGTPSGSVGKGGALQEMAYRPSSAPEAVPLREKSPGRIQLQGDEKNASGIPSGTPEALGFGLTR